MLKKTSFSLLAVFCLMTLLPSAQTAVIPDETAKPLSPRIASIVELVPMSTNCCLINYKTNMGAFGLLAVTSDGKGRSSFGNEIIHGGSLLRLDSTHAATSNSGMSNLRLLIVDGNRLTLGPSTVDLSRAQQELRLNRVANGRLFITCHANDRYQGQLYKIAGDVFERTGATVNLPMSGKSLFADEIAKDRSLLFGGDMRLTIMSSKDDNIQFLKVLQLLGSDIPVASLNDGKLLIKSVATSREDVCIGIVDDSSITFGPSVRLNARTAIVPGPSSIKDRAFFLAGEQGGWIVADGINPSVSLVGRIYDSAIETGFKAAMMDRDHLLVVSAQKGQLKMYLRPIGKTLPKFAK